ncbi:hypothetical protein HDU93_002146 [Gonapodya sp. JEL0774]|nr:hypothetical protein HDU93_002146 [Gonapodya sp. JEL0774]
MSIPLLTTKNPYLLITRSGFDPSIHVPPALRLRRARWWIDPGNTKNSRFAGKGNEEEDIEGAPVEILVTVAVHGNEQCGLRAINHLLSSQFFPSSANIRHFQPAELAADFDLLASVDGDETAFLAIASRTYSVLESPGLSDWPFAWDSLTVVLGNPAAVLAKKRFVDTNLNRTFTADIIADAVKKEGLHLASPKAFRLIGVPDPLSTKSYSQPPIPVAERSLVPPIAYLISHSTSLLDIHSTSSPTAAFSIPHNHQLSRAMCAGLPVPFVVEGMLDVQEGTTGCWAREVGMAKAGGVECGQHDAEESFQKAVEILTHLLFIDSPVSPSTTNTPPRVLHISSSVFCRSNFRYVKSPPPPAFAHIAEGEIVAEDERGKILCDVKGGAYLVMPVAEHLVHVGEEAWVWGVQKKDVN